MNGYASMFSFEKKGGNKVVLWASHVYLLKQLWVHSSWKLSYEPTKCC